MICAGGGHLRLRSGIPLTPAPTPETTKATRRVALKSSGAPKRGPETTASAEACIAGAGFEPATFGL